MKKLKFLIPALMLVFFSSITFPFVFFLTITKHKIAEINVKEVPRTNSMILFENRLPKVLNTKKTEKIQIRISIILLFIPFTSCLYLIHNTVNMKAFSSIENVSKDFISSTELSLPTKLCHKEFAQSRSKSGIAELFQV